MIALRDAWLAGLFRRGNWLPNIVSGVIVGVVARWKPASAHWSRPMPSRA